MCFKTREIRTLSRRCVFETLEFTRFIQMLLLVSVLFVFPTLGLTIEPSSSIKPTVLGLLTKLSSIERLIDSFASNILNYTPEEFRLMVQHISKRESSLLIPVVDALIDEKKSLSSNQLIAVFITLSEVGNLSSQALRLSRTIIREFSRRIKKKNHLNQDQILFFTAALLDLYSAEPSLLSTQVQVIQAVLTLANEESNTFTQIQKICQEKRQSKVAAEFCVSFLPRPPTPLKGANNRKLIS